MNCGLNYNYKNLAMNAQFNNRSVRKNGNEFSTELGRNEDQITDKILQVDTKKSETTKQIVVNPDGTRILVITTVTAGGLTTTISLKLSETNELDDAKEPIDYEKSNQSVSLFKSQTAIAAYDA